MTIEEKWQAAKDKASYAKQFPGMVTMWEALVGKTVARALPLNKKPFVLLLFSDRSFAFAPSLDLDPSDLIPCLEEARPHLEKVYPEAYKMLDDLALKNRELQRRARLEKIIGAIRNNLSDIPELKDELKKFLERL
jgi:hypothetical protein